MLTDNIIELISNALLLRSKSEGISAKAEFLNPSGSINPWHRASNKKKGLRQGGKERVKKPQPVALSKLIRTLLTKVRFRGKIYIVYFYKNCCLPGFCFSF